MEILPYKSLLWGKKTYSTFYVVHSVGRKFPEHFMLSMKGLIIGLSSFLYETKTKPKLYFVNWFKIRKKETEKHFNYPSQIKFFAMTLRAMIFEMSI